MRAVLVVVIDDDEAAVRQADNVGPSVAVGVAAVDVVNPADVGAGGGHNLELNVGVVGVGILPGDDQAAASERRDGGRDVVFPVCARIPRGRYSGASAAAVRVE